MRVAVKLEKDQIKEEVIGTGMKHTMPGDVEVEGKVIAYDPATGNAELELSEQETGKVMAVIDEDGFVARKKPEEGEP